MIKAALHKHILKFNNAVGTSRGILYEKPTWFIKVFIEENENTIGIGECSPIWGLSPEKENEYESLLEHAVKNIDGFEMLLKNDLKKYPSLYFGVETAMLDLFKNGKRILFDNDFTNHKSGILINGLVWMNSLNKMFDEAIQKNKTGFNCIKLKVGVHKIDEEIIFLKELRSALKKNTIIRLDANGAYDSYTALNFLNSIADLKIHSIEQPLKAGENNELKILCKNSKVPIALDESLIGIFETDKKNKLLDDIKPQYIILKPSLHGGFFGVREWINIAEKNNIDWWLTSALESNIGLNAIAQFTHQSNKKGYHGLGTGSLYTNNITSPLYVNGEQLFYSDNSNWKINF